MVFNFTVLAAPKGRRNLALLKLTAFNHFLSRIKNALLGCVIQSPPSRTEAEILPFSRRAVNLIYSGNGGLRSAALCRCHGCLQQRGVPGHTLCSQPGQGGCWNRPQGLAGGGRRHCLSSCTETSSAPAWPSGIGGCKGSI